jgi:hypothetical protein
MRHVPPGPQCRSGGGEVVPGSLGGGSSGPRNRSGRPGSAPAAGSLGGPARLPKSRGSGAQVAPTARYADHEDLARVITSAAGAPGLHGLGAAVQAQKKNGPARLHGPAGERRKRHARMRGRKPGRRCRAATPAEPGATAAPASGDVIEVERNVNASGNVSLGDHVLSAGLPLAGEAGYAAAGRAGRPRPVWRHSGLRHRLPGPIRRPAPVAKACAGTAQPPACPSRWLSSGGCRRGPSWWAAR